MKNIIVSLMIFCGLVWSQDSTLYVSKYATGTGDGSSWTNAITDVPYLTLKRGYTYFVADGNYLDTGCVINIAENGEHWITIKKATVDTHGTEDGWNDTLGDGQAVFTESIGIKCGYIHIDGSVRGDSGGFLPDTNQYGFKIKQKATNTAWHYLIKAPHSDNMDYLRVDKTFFSNTGWDANYGQVGIYIGGDFANEHYIINDCAFYRQSTCIIGYDADYLQVTNCVFVESWSNESCCHGQSLSFGEETDSIIFAYNKVYLPTTFIFGTHAIQDYGEFGWKIHHNIFVGDGGSMTGGIANANSSTDTNSMAGCHIYHNTFYNFEFSRGAIYIGQFNLSAENKNLIENNLFVNIVDAGMTDTISMDKDYNFFINCTESYRVDDNDSVVTADVNSVFRDVSSNDFRLVTPLLINNELAGYETDLAGNTRGVNTDWSVGAYGYAGDTPAPQRNRLAKCWLRIED